MSQRIEIKANRKLVRIGPMDIDDELDKNFRQEIVRRYGGKKGDLTKALEYAIGLFLKTSDPIIFQEGERKILAQTLEFEFLRRDVGMATKDEVDEIPAMKSVIKKLSDLVQLAKKLELIRYAETSVKGA